MSIPIPPKLETPDQPSQPSAGPVLGFGGLLLLIAVPLFLRMPLTNDATLFDLQTRMIAEGSTPYREVLEPNWPGVFWVHGAVRAVLGPSSEALRLFDLSGVLVLSWMLRGLAESAGAMASGTFNDGSFNLALKALVRNGSAKILAEPNLVALSGHSATFLSGGEFAVPTVVGVGGAQAATTTFKGFGTSLNFLPTVLDKDRIRLEVTPTFSTLNRANAVGGVFGLDTRTVNTVVDLREGQVFAIAGLLQEQQRGDSVRLPYIGDWKLFNLLTDSRSITRDETELIVLVTPELVHALEPNQVPSILPGMEVTEPTDHDFYWHGNIEGRPNCHHRSTVWPLYKKRMKQAGYSECESFQKSEQFYIQGEHGFSTQ